MEQRRQVVGRPAHQGVGLGGEDNPDFIGDHRRMLAEGWLDVD
jgi:hypothetical protein